jgi:hypothetical protein
MTPDSFPMIWWMLDSVIGTVSTAAGSTYGRTRNGTAMITAAKTASVTAIAATVLRNRIPTATPSTNAKAA